MATRERAASSERSWRDASQSSCNPALSSVVVRTSVMVMSDNGTVRVHGLMTY